MRAQRFVLLITEAVVDGERRFILTVPDGTTTLFTREGEDDFALIEGLVADCNRDLGI